MLVCLLAKEMWRTGGELESSDQEPLCLDRVRELLFLFKENNTFIVGLF